VGEAVTVEPIGHKGDFLGRCDAHTSGETSIGMLQASKNH
jgi:hypothetical protein